MGRSTGFRAALLLVVAPVALAAGGCGSGGGTSSAHSARRASAPAIAAGCTAALPRAIAPSPAGWSTIVRICASTDGSKLLLHNASMAAVLRVTGTTTATTLQQQGGGSTTSLADRIVARVAPATCGGGACVVPPGHQLLASGSPASIDFSAVRVSTLAVSAARSYATWAQEESPRASRLSTQIFDCAKQTGAAGASSSTPWFAAFERVYRTGTPCGRAVTAAMADAGTGERPAVDVFENLARGADEGAWNDAIGYGVARVTAR